ncbi:bacteriocin [Flavobacterium sp. GCM10023249]
MTKYFEKLTKEQLQKIYGGQETEDVEKPKIRIPGQQN